MEIEIGKAYFYCGQDFSVWISYHKSIIDLSLVNFGVKRNKKNVTKLNKFCIKQKLFTSSAFYILISKKGYWYMFQEYLYSNVDVRTAQKKKKDSQFSHFCESCDCYG